MNLKEQFKKSKFIRRVYQKYQDIKYAAATIISPELNTKMRYKDAFGKKLDLENPVTLNEKLLWLKLNKYMKDPLVTKCADKYAVREYVAECGCSEILNELIGVWDRAEDISWDKLPDKFVLKWNFGAGMNIICDNKQKLDKDETLKQLKKWGKVKYWLSHSEMQYKYAPKKIVCEKYLNDGKGFLPQDYKVYCFNGKPTHVMLCVGREFGHPKFYFFDKNWELSRISRDSKAAPENFTVEKPKCIEDIFKFAEILSKPFPFVRADFYVVDDKVYFGELTFTPAGALDSARLPETDKMFGDMLKIDELKEEKKGFKK